MNCNFCLYQDQKSVLYIRIFLMDASLNGKMFPIEVSRCPPELWDLCLMIWRKCHLRWLMNQEWRIYKLSKVNITLSKGIESLSLIPLSSQSNVEDLWYFSNYESCLIKLFKFEISKVYNCRLHSERNVKFEFVAKTRLIIFLGFMGYVF